MDQRAKNVLSAILAKRLDSIRLCAWKIYNQLWARMLQTVLNLHLIPSDYVNRRWLFHPSDSQLFRPLLPSLLDPGLWKSSRSPAGVLRVLLRHWEQLEFRQRRRLPPPPQGEHQVRTDERSLQMSCSSSREQRNKWTPWNQREGRQIWETWTAALLSVNQHKTVRL